MYNLLNKRELKAFLPPFITLSLLCSSSMVFAADSPVVQIIKSNAQGFAVDAGDGAAELQNIALMTADESNANQQWTELDRGDGYYSYQKVGTDFCIDGNDGGSKNQNVYLSTCDESSENQHWQKVDLDGAYQLIKRNAPSYALNGGSDGVDGQNINLWSSASASKNLQWLVNELGSDISVASVSATADDGNVPANTLDGDLTTRWSAFGDSQTITYKLTETVTLGSLDIAFYKGDQRLASFEVQVSEDASTWQTLFEGEQPELTLDPLTLQFDGASASYVRIVGHGNSSNKWNSITAVELYSADSSENSEDGNTDEDIVGDSADWMENIQLYGHGYSVPTDFTDDEFEYIANTFDVFTVEKRHAYNSYGGNPSTERATIGTAEKLKSINPDIKVLLYWNSVLSYTGLYETNTEIFAEHPEWVHSTWETAAGVSYDVYDLDNIDCQDWWVDAVSSIIEDGDLDGVFIDAGPKAGALDLIEGLSTAIDRVRARVGDDKMVIYNGYRVVSSTYMQAGPELIEHTSGVFVEFFLHAPLDTKEEAVLLFDELTEAYEDGKVIGLRGSPSHYLPGAEDPFLFTFASAMLFYGPNTYWLYNSSYNKTAWMYDYRSDYYDIATGASQGSPQRDGWVYTREFENITVRVDLENVTASITYKETTDDSSNSTQSINEAVVEVEFDEDLLDGEEGLFPALGWDGTQYNSVTYKTVDDEPMVLDIFLPDVADDSEPVPVVIYTHGGGWYTGSQDNLGYGYKKWVANALLDAGVAVVSVDYRLTASGSIIQDCVIDSKDAARFIAKYASWYNIDPQNMAFFGDSAGAHIAMNVGLTDNDAEAYLGAEELVNYNDFSVKGIVAWYGPVSFSSEQEDFWGGRSLNGFSDRLYGDESDTDIREQMSELVSPIAFYNSEDPYLHIIHGDMDTTIDHGHLQGMASYAETNNIVKFSSQTVVGAGHNFKQAGDDAIQPTAGTIVDQSVEKLLSFLNID